jgi:purine-nucleoside phosphorylase
VKELSVNVQTPMYERVEHAAREIRSRYSEDVRVGLVLGSGLGAFADELEESVEIPYEEIKGFARSTVEGHAGRLVLGKVEGVPVAVMQGRFHYYEGYEFEEVVFPIRTLGVLGIKSLILTNAAGGINVAFDQGALMVISDHLNLMGVNPLRGVHDNRFGERFPDMSEVYTRDYQEIAVAEGQAMGLELRRGIYAALSGPSYETPAEIRMMRILGADAVGMSTVPEAIIARQMGIKVLGISCITNMAAGVVGDPINHQEVMETGERVRDTFKELLRRIIPKLVISSQ